MVNWKSIWKKQIETDCEAKTEKKNLYIFKKMNLGKTETLHEKKFQGKKEGRRWGEVKRNLKKLKNLPDSTVINL